MEALAITEVFQNSLEMYDIIYSKLIAAGDSNFHKMLSPATTQWLPLEACVNRTLEQNEVLSEYFKDEVFKDHTSLKSSVSHRIKSTYCSKRINEDADRHYGNSCPKPDLNEVDYEFGKTEHFKELKLTEEDRKAEKLLKNELFCNRIPWNGFRKDDSAIQAHCSDREHIALGQLAVLRVDGACPDGLLEDDKIVGVKCPYSRANMTTKNDAKMKKITFWKFKKSDDLIINKNHDRFHRAQGPHQKNEYLHLYGFYLDCMLPDIIDSRLDRTMQVREPNYITEALLDAETKKKILSITCDVLKHFKSVTEIMSAEMHTTISQIIVLANLLLKKYNETIFKDGMPDVVVELALPQHRTLFAFKTYGFPENNKNSVDNAKKYLSNLASKTVLTTDEMPNATEIIGNTAQNDQTECSSICDDFVIKVILSITCDVLKHFKSVTEIMSAEMHTTISQIIVLANLLLKKYNETIFKDGMPDVVVELALPQHRTLFAFKTYGFPENNKYSVDNAKKYLSNLASKTVLTTDEMPNATEIIGNTAQND
ncbi:Uncharacterized protein OBRU01_16982 [Operophtera brumata]|uniref:YqaJ viral recombinase domain-containing protein n=1 Tax=Operophtera brumata TaxID=104452 RepID=A0A0L7L245_OPEBR|nr:Uncharacterized protein OBRU01_16982 [Operophtera brumata]